MTPEEKDQRIAELEAQLQRERTEAEYVQRQKGLIIVEQSSEIERMRTALKGISNQRFQGNPSSDRLHNCIGIARAALSGNPAPQADPKDATIERRSRSANAINVRTRCTSACRTWMVRSGLRCRSRCLGSSAGSPSTGRSHRSIPSCRVRAGYGASFGGSRIRASGR